MVSGGNTGWGDSFQMDNCAFVFAGELSAHDTSHIMYYKTCNAFIAKFSMYLSHFKNSTIQRRLTAELML